MFLSRGDYVLEPLQLALGARGFDAHKRVKGRKRHILVDKSRVTASRG